VPDPAFLFVGDVLTILGATGKIGLLPKRPVSLLRVEDPPKKRDDDDDDELEYVENPFESKK
jgi:hypothetical protein